MSKNIFSVLFLYFLLLFSSVNIIAEMESLAKAVSGAKTGSTVKLSVGTYRGGITLPQGVILKGAGVGKTIIDASNLPVGIEISGGAKAILSDFTITGATRINIAVNNSKDTIVRCVRTTGSINGITFTNVMNGRMENVVSDNNRYGLVAGAGKNNVIVNCTAARNSSLGISLSSGFGTIAFNNCVSESATGIYLGSKLSNAKIDYNLYSALYAGKLEGQLGRKSIGEWNYLCGQDEHSITIPVAFKNPEAGDFTPVNALSWALNRTPVTGFGSEKFMNYFAPSYDILGNKRTKSIDLGAYVASLSPPRNADGTFIVKTGTGITSAGVFTKEGKEICYLFHNLPLTKGRYSFWLPSRDFQYKPITAGTYEVRTVESKLKLEYLGKIGDTGKESPFGADASLGAARITFDAQGHLLAGNDGWAEDFIDVRGYDGTSGKYLWAFRAGADTRGLVVGKDGNSYLLRRADKDARLTKLNPTNGHVVTWKDGGYSAILTGGGNMNGITELNGMLYITDNSGIYIINPITPIMTPPIILPGASYPSADISNNLIWVLSQGKLVAIKPDGTKILPVTPVVEPIALAVRNGRMAIASKWKIYIFDCTDPNSLKPLGNIGTGDGPYGEFSPYRFTFQYPPSMAISTKGEIAIGDGVRILVFDANGKSLWYSLGVFGNGTIPSFGVTPRCFDLSNWSFAFDLKNKTWKPEAFWPQTTYFPNSQFRGEISCDSKTFGIYAINAGKDHGTGFTKVLGYKSIPILLITGNGNNWVSRKDTNKDGIINDQDIAIPFVTNGLSFDNPAPRSNGDIMAGTTLWHCTGVDNDSAPIYSANNTISWKSPNSTGFISPYTGQKDNFSIASLHEINDNILGALINVNSAPGRTGLFNGAGTDMAGFDISGNMRWMHPLAIHKGLYNFQAIGPVYLSGVGQTSEIVCVDKDGLGLGTFGQSAVSNYTGYWLDHPGAVQAWQGQDGQYYLLIADNYHGMHHWYQMSNQDKIIRNTLIITISDMQAKSLADLPSPDPKLASQRPATPNVILPRLKEALPIDGDLEKWRKAGISPNIIITPDTAVDGIDGPLDASAVIRMAYHGKDLYVQILRFDNNPVFFQPVSRHYLQPCVEMCINGFGPGFKFDISKTTDAGDMIIRQRFYFTKLERLLSNQNAPRIIKLLDNAKDVSEREMIESVYGVDLSVDKVIVTEFKLPMDTITYEGAEADVPSMKPGSSFWLGFMIDDNNQPGADLQNLMVWPATYGTFNPPEDGAKAILGE